ncbi:IclR family transcriptional regulator C-terminal domain-containing protein [Stenotrophomonas pavanii]|uniref:IclR family transcriptional regulator domain-containing protein n=1 Tax=Stenotrophomonas TaxID=40323 RepID=UPI001658994C|nr:MULTISPECIES: IclR family transcriptional regulator C-terminal domain-containing protein [Stenotrophomonas]MBC9079425.1 helix-turn-helix domain-containing protein [Stenotrophomonas maltophilia]MBH1388393.1 helix-turn-helix domain-containing protein [Stenotrophomonas maltophilia]MBH1522314.1 helix-turn-helix domain-containing protein [Stenotrophomonas maltophilia]MCF3465553.1 helix-turn-helix domain-containing protein [Stenotrophomonas maltophilia]MCF3485250.1 helix-turn-helix domain-contain
MPAVPPSRSTKRPLAPPRDRGLAHELMQQIQENQGDPDFMTSLGRGLAVLSVFSQHPREVTMSQISSDTGISRAAVRRVLYTLEKLGYVGEQGRGYVLLPRVLGMGGAYVASSSMTAAAQPVLDALRDDVHESCSLGVLDGDDILYVARAETVRIMSIGLRAGSRLPAYCTSMGRVLLAALPRDTLEGYLERTPLRPRTERTVTRMEDFLDLLEKVRREGVSLVDQELEIGLRSIAVPVRSRSGEVVAALNIGTQAGRIGLGVMQTQLLPRLREAAQRLGTLLN